MTRDRLVGLLAVAGVLALAAVESFAGLWGSWREPAPSDWQALATALRAEHQPGDLIAVAPAWADPLARQQLGDLMPIAMLGRPDAKRYPHIFEITQRGARSEDSAGLQPDWTRRFGPLSLRHYSQPTQTVAYDFVEHFLDAHVSDRPGGATGSLSASQDPGAPCLWQGPPPATCGQAEQGRGPSGAFYCGAGRVERRTLEIAYRPRYGLSVDCQPGRTAQLDWDAIPDAAWAGSALHVWLGLHDYYARKNARGPADVLIDVDDGAVRQTVRIEPRDSERTLQHVVITLPARREGARLTHRVRIAASAEQAPHHFVGLIAELRR